MDKGEFADNGQWIRDALARYERVLMLYAGRITGDPERARDVVQETFLRLCEQARGEAEPHLAEWLFGVCRNLALDVRRKEGRISPLNLGEAAVRKSPALAPIDLAERKEDAALILDMLETLSENQQEVIRLKFQHGLSYKEIAKVTSLTVTNVGFLIHTGLKTLRARLCETQNAVSKEEHKP